MNIDDGGGGDEIDDGGDDDNLDNGENDDEDDYDFDNDNVRMVMLARIMMAMLIIMKSIMIG